MRWGKKKKKLPTAGCPHNPHKDMPQWAHSSVKYAVSDLISPSQQISKEWENNINVVMWNSTKKYLTTSKWFFSYKVGHKFPYIVKCIMYIFFDVSETLEDAFHYLWFSLGATESCSVSSEDTRHKSSRGTHHQHYKHDANCANATSSTGENTYYPFSKQW